MCWNQYISLNTFLFSTFVLLLIAYNNNVSPYKINDFDSIYVYLFFMSFILMQLIEFFIWRNLNNHKLNHLFSLLGAFLIFIQPIMSLLMLKKHPLLKQILIPLYAIPAFVYFISEYNHKKFTTSLTKKGHLQWNWVNFIGEKQILLYIWLFFLFFSLFMNAQYAGLIFVIFLFLFSFYNKTIAKDKSTGTLWCWSINSFMILYSIQLLIILPYKEHGGFC